MLCYESCEWSMIHFYLNVRLYHHTIKMSECTLNHTIKTMLTGKRHLNLEYIKTRIKNNVKLIDNTVNSNTLSYVLRYFIKDLKYVDTQRIKELINHLINVGAKPSNNHQITKSMKNYVYVMGSYQRNGIKNLKIGRSELELSEEYNTLNLSFETKDLEIIRMIRNAGAYPDNTFTDNNTLVCSLRTGCPCTVKEAILSGAFIPNEKMSNFMHINYGIHGEKWIMDYQYHNLIFPSFCRSNPGRNIDLLIELMIICGLPMVPLNNISRRTCENDLISSYGDLINHQIDKLNKKNPIVGPHIIELLGRLETLKNQIIRDADENIKNRSMIYYCIGSLPECCIDIIHEYNMLTEIGLLGELNIPIHDWTKMLNI